MTGHMHPESDFDPNATLLTTSPDKPRSSVLRWVFVAFFSLALIVFDPAAGLLYSAINTSNEATPDPATTPSPMLEMQGKYAVGVEALTKKPYADVPFAPGPEQYIDMADGNPIDLVRAVPLIAELYEQEDALETITSLRADSTIEFDEGLTQDLDIIQRIIEGNGASPDERQRLIDRHGYFGELAVANIEDDQDAADIRDALVAESKGLAVKVFAFGGVVIAAMLVGFALLIIFSVLFAIRTFRTEFGAHLRETPSREHKIGRAHV